MQEKYKGAKLKETHKVLVYGTLRKGFSNHSLLVDSKFVGRRSVLGTMYSLGGFPAVVLSGAGQVNCELYEVDENTLRRLDRLESHPVFYQRVPVPTLESGGTEAPWMYTMASEAIPQPRVLIQSGDWEEWKARKASI